MVENSRRKTHPHLTPVESPGVLPNVRRVPSPWICSKALPHAPFQTPVFNKWTGEATFSSAVTHGFPAIDHCTCLSLFSRALSPQPFLTPHPSPWPPAQCTSLLQACSEFSPLLPLLSNEPYPSSLQRPHTCCMGTHPTRAAFMALVTARHLCLLCHLCLSVPGPSSGLGTWRLGNGQLPS